MLPRRPALGPLAAPRLARVAPRGHEVVEFDGPVLELMTERAHALRPRIAALGPDILADEFDADALPAPAARGRPDARRSATPCSTSARSPASATCGRPRAASGRAIDPWRPTGEVSDDEACAIVDGARPRMQQSARDGLPGARPARSTAAPAGRAPAAARRSARAARATTTARPTGARDASAEALGHKGADLIAPGNTLASFDAALEAGVDMIEFDVLPERRRRAARARPRLPATRAARRRPRWSRASTHLAARRVRRPGPRRRPQAPRLRGAGVDALRERGLDGRASSPRSTSPSSPTSGGRARAAPGLVGAQGRARLHSQSPPTRVPALAACALRARPSRAAPPARCASAGSTRSWPTGAWSARPWSRAVRGAGGELYVWTVDERERIAQLEALGVTGVITNDPRLFAQRLISHDRRDTASAEGRSGPRAAPWSASAGGRGPCGPVAPLHVDVPRRTMRAPGFGSGR